MLNTEELEKIKSDLPRNYAKLIIEVFNKKGLKVSRATIIRVLNNETVRPDVIEAALKVIDNHKKKIMKLKSRI